MPDILAHDWFRPKLTALLAEADAAGYARDVSQAAITDLVNGALASAAPAKADEAWAQDIDEPDYMVNEPGVDVQGDLGGQVRNPLDHLGRGNRFV